MMLCNDEGIHNRFCDKSRGLMNELLARVQQSCVLCLAIAVSHTWTASCAKIDKVCRQCAESVHRAFCNPFENQILPT